MLLTKYHILRYFNNYKNLISTLEQDNINEYYAVRHKSDGRYHNESSSETSSIQNNPLRKPNFEAPPPAKGILKKSNSNPHLTKLEQETKSNGPPGRVVDIKKYLAQVRNISNIIPSDFARSHFAIYFI